ncbi:MAG TPA: DUF1987 domain-containing protein [Bacteroidetes bacterium]|nr:DUF1987 domain-containing protein [Bacteroidota bacterium]
MENLFIEKSPATPRVELNASTGVLLIEGRSIPENSESFFEPLLTWIDQYFRNPSKQTILNLKLEYVNSGTSKYLMEILRTLRKYHNQGHDVLVNWYYEEEDESMYELGVHYQESVSIPLRLNVVYL